MLVQPSLVAGFERIPELAAQRIGKRGQPVGVEKPAGRQLEQDRPEPVSQAADSLKIGLFAPAIRLGIEPS